MDRIQELLTRLADLSDAEIAELEGLILSEFDSVEAEEPTNDSVERMVGLADALDSVRGEVGRRNERAQELAQQASDASARVHASREEAPAEAEMASKDDEDEETPEGELPSEDEIAEDIEQVTEDVVEAVEDAEAAGEEKPLPRKRTTRRRRLFSEDTPAEAELSDSNDTIETVTETVETTDTELSSDSEAQPEQDPISSEQENPMTASIESDGVVVTPPADAAPVPSLTASGVALTITAGADIPGYGTGAALSNMDQVADAFAKRLHTLRNVQGGSGRSTPSPRWPSSTPRIAGSLARTRRTSPRSTMSSRSRPSPLLPGSALRWSRSTTSTSAATTTVRSATLWPASTRTVAA